MLPLLFARRRHRLAGWCAALLVIGHGAYPAEAFVVFESEPVRPLAMTPDNRRLLAVNTPDGTLEILLIRPDGLHHEASVPVGMEPVAVAVRNAGEVWVVNHLSDSISIVDLSAVPPRVVKTLLVGDEPRDIVFAGPGRDRAFITTAHRGQHSPYTDPADPGELTTPGIGRADVWVFDAADTGVALGGEPLTILTLFGDTPRALAVSADGTAVYAAVFRSGNGTTVVHARAVCDGGEAAAPCPPTPGELLAPGGLPAPNSNVEAIAQPETGLIVRHSGGQWQDELGRDWSDLVRFGLPDLDVFKIDALANPPVEVAAVSQVGTILFNMIVNPVDGTLYVTNTEARNEVRFEGTRPPGDPNSSVIGHLHEARISVLDASGVRVRHLNKHIDYSVVPAPPQTLSDSLATPLEMAMTADGSKLFVAAFGSGKIGVFDTATLEDDSFVPDAASHVPVSGGGPGGLVLDEARRRLYVSTRFDNGLSIIDIDTLQEISHQLLHNPEPEEVTTGRKFLYDATLTSSNGEASCAGCHVFGDLDALGWDLGNPLGLVKVNSNPGVGIEPPSLFHPMKGPMTTQSLRGLDNHGPMHWRGDRTAADSGGDPLDELGAFVEFNVAFEGLIGRAAPLAPADMLDFAEFALQVVYPPNPIRSFDNTLTASQQLGQAFFFGGPASNTGGQLFSCSTCHELDSNQGFFGTGGLASFIAAPQDFKIPHLRNLYQKVGMFGMPDVENLTNDDNVHTGDQIRGFGFFHDGSLDTINRFHSDVIFTDETHAARLDLEQFVLAFDSSLAPVVGQQGTLTHQNAATVDSWLDLLLSRSALGECDVVVSGIIAGEARSAARIPEGPAAGLFRSDRAAEPLIAAAALRALANTPGQPLTFTCVPPGSGERMGVDRDGDGVFNGDDNCAMHPNADQSDVDGDGAGDVCDPVAVPLPSILANGSAAALTIQSGSPLEIVASASAGDFAGVPSEAWIDVDTPMGSYWWTLAGGWVASAVPVRAYSGALAGFGPVPLVQELGLPAGEYSFRFVLDDSEDDNFDITVLETLKVTILE